MGIELIIYALLAIGIGWLASVSGAGAGIESLLGSFGKGVGIGMAYTGTGLSYLAKGISDLLSPRIAPRVEFTWYWGWKAPTSDATKGARNGTDEHETIPMSFKPLPLPAPKPLPRLTLPDKLKKYQMI